MNDDFHETGNVDNFHENSYENENNESADYEEPTEQVCDFGILREKKKKRNKE